MVYIGRGWLIFPGARLIQVGLADGSNATANMAADQNDDLSFAAALAFLYRHRRLVIGTGLVVFAIVASYSLLRPRIYTSTASFMPQSSDNVLSRFSGLAATFGVQVPASDPGSSPPFYSGLLKSRDVLRETVLTPYLVREKSDTVRRTLVDIYASEGSTADARRDAASERLLKDIMVSIGRETGVVELEVTSKDPGLSQQIAQRMIQLVSQFNLERRQSNAGSERRFVESRNAEARRALEAAEDRLQTFLQQNREYRSAPSLVFQYERLQRDVLLQQQLYGSLSQALEQARIDEVRNTPVITIIEPPDRPSKPDARYALVKAILGLLVGFGLGALLAGGWDLVGDATRWPTRTDRLSEARGNPGLARNVQDNAGSDQAYGVRKSG
jgi:uncharacterized protein involved in exopolysaccharide biosynthesis